MYFSLKLPFAQFLCVFYWSWLAEFRLLLRNVWVSMSKAWGNTFLALQRLGRPWAGNFLWERYGGFRWYPSFQLFPFLSTHCFSFCSTRICISDTEVIPAFYVNDMVTCVMLVLQDLNLPALSSNHLWSLAVSGMTLPWPVVRPRHPLHCCFDFCQALLLVVAEKRTPNSSTRAIAVSSSATELVLLEKGRVSLLPCI